VLPEKEVVGGSKKPGQPLQPQSDGDNGDDF
jgi:hypothetical protein